MTGKELLDLLRRNGWVLDRIRGSHHIMIKGDRTISVPVHGSRDLPKGLVKALFKQGGLR